MSDSESTANKKRSLAPYLTPFIICALIVVALLLLRNVKPEQPRKDPNKRPASTPALTVEATTVKRQAYIGNIKTLGRIEAKQRSRLSSEINSRVTYLNPLFEDGHRFKKGALLIALDNASHRADLAIAKAELAQAQAALDEEQARGQQAKLDWTTMHGRQKAPELALRKPQLASAKANIKAAKAKVQKAETALAKTEIRAPYNGVVISRNTDIGELASPSMPLGEIMSADRFKVTLPLNSADVKLIDTSPNSPVTLRQGIEYIEAQLVALTDFIDPSTQQRQAIVEYSTTNSGTPPFIVGDYVEATFSTIPLEEVFVIPANVLYQNRYVNVLERIKGQDYRESSNSSPNMDHFTLQRRSVLLIWQDNLVTVIRKGLNNGDHVVTTPLNGVISGTTVTIRSPSASPLTQPSTQSHQHRDGRQGALTR